MAPKLNDNPMVHVLAADLELKSSANPVAEIVTFCRRKVLRFLADFRDCKNPSQLLTLVANKLGTQFIEIHSDADLDRVIQEFSRRGEKSFANLRNEFCEQDLGITLRLAAPARCGLPYVSIIDYRGQKARRSYFTRWHELGHLLILTDQRRLAFKRTHSLHEPKTPEESLVDVIAGEFAYFEPMVRPLAVGEISFATIERIRQALCPDGSFTSSVIGVTKAWPTPCLSIAAQMALKKGEADDAQATFGFRTGPSPALRATSVTINEAARKRGIQMYPNFRVPAQSVIAKVFRDGLSEAEATEDLSWWRASDGTELPALPLKVLAKRRSDCVYALLLPKNTKRI